MHHSDLIKQFSYLALWNLSLTVQQAWIKVALFRLSYNQYNSQSHIFLRYKQEPILFVLFETCNTDTSQTFLNFVQLQPKTYLKSLHSHSTISFNILVIFTQRKLVWSFSNKGSVPSPYFLLRTAINILSFCKRENYLWLIEKQLQ